MFLFSFLLVSNWIALAFRVTEEGQAGISSAAGAFLGGCPCLGWSGVFGKVQKGVCIYCMLAKHILCLSVFAAVI